MRMLGALALLVTLAACGTDTGRASDPAGGPESPSSSAPSGSPQAGVPPARGEVATRGLATVLDTGAGGPELCLGAVAASYPPQCHGIPLSGWDWSQRQGQFDTSGEVRWGQFVVRGTFDGTRLSVTGAIPEASYDPAGREPGGLSGEPGQPGDAGAWQPGEQASIQRKLETRPLPGTLTVTPTPAAVVVEVVHDDGSLQRQVDKAYGAGRVSVRSQLVPVDG